MSDDTRLDAVEQFYEFHPISAQQIFDAVAARGIAREHISEEVLQHHDQDHYGGTAAVDRLMAEAAVRADDRVLDVCSGVAGLAQRVELGQLGVDGAEDAQRRRRAHAVFPEARRHRLGEQRLALLFQQRSAGNAERDVVQVKHGAAPIAWRGGIRTGALPRMPR